MRPVAAPLPLAEVRSQLRALLANEPDLVANAANFTALVARQLSDINWLGFYFLHGDELVLGPFQGKPACVRIALGQGVCGVAAQSGETRVVGDVRAFAGHIACDPDSASELVVPLFDADGVVGVFDIDSPIQDRFGAADVLYVEALVRDFCSIQFA